MTQAEGPLRQHEGGMMGSLGIKRPGLQSLWPRVAEGCGRCWFGIQLLKA